MKWCVYLLLLFFACCGDSYARARFRVKKKIQPPPEPRPEDPFSPIKIEKLSNGMTIVLAPTTASRNIDVELRVLTGWAAEQKSNIGVAHLTEHVLFRDPKLGQDQSYLQRIKEEGGGEANGKTSWKQTSFLASVPSLKGFWVLNEFARMVMYRKIDGDSLEKSKSEVLLEIGEPDNVFQSLFSMITPLAWEPPDFFESEFQVKGKNEPDDRIRRSTMRLSSEQVQNYYDSYYKPSNMVLFVAGPVKLKETMEFIKETYEPFEDSKVEKSEDEDPVPRESPYLRSRVANRDSWISIGTKFWNIDPEDGIVLKIYFDYLAHRLMKKLRNESGETYSADVSFWTDEKRYGYAVVSFETPRYQFKKNLAYVQDLLREETNERKFSDEEIDKARQLYAHQYELIDTGADAMLSLANRLYDFQTMHQSQATPHQIFQATFNEDFKDRLQKLFALNRRYLSVVEPPLLFRGEHVILWILSVLVSIFLCRTLYLRPFAHKNIRYVRKIKYQPATLFFLSILFINVMWVASQLAVGTDLLLLNINFVQSTFVLSEYAKGTILIVFATCLVFGFFSLIPRKIILMDDKLIIKSISYFSRVIPVTLIRSIRVIRPHQVLLERLWHRHFRWLHWSLWKKGLILTLKDGREYYFGFRNSDTVARELVGFLPPNADLPADFKLPPHAEITPIPMRKALKRKKIA